MEHKVDVRAENHGSLWRFVLLSPTAWEWVSEHVEVPSYMQSKTGFAAEHRYALNIAHGMMADGLEVEGA